MLFRSRDLKDYIGKHRETSGEGKDSGTSWAIKMKEKGVKNKYADKIKGVCERNDERTKASFGVGKSVTKTKGSLRSQRSMIEYTALIKTVLVRVTGPAYCSVSRGVVKGARGE